MVRLITAEEAKNSIVSVKPRVVEAALVAYVKRDERDFDERFKTLIDTIGHRQVVELIAAGRSHFFGCIRTEIPCQNHKGHTNEGKQSTPAQ